MAYNSLDNQNFKPENILFIGNPNTTHAGEAAATLYDIQHETRLGANTTREIYHFPTRQDFEDSIPPKTLVVVFSGDGGQRNAVEALSHTSPTTQSNATLLFARAGNGQNAGLDVGVRHSMGEFLTHSTPQPLNLLKYALKSDTKDVIDEGIALTCVNIGVTGAASYGLEQHKPWLRELGNLRRLPEGLIVLGAAVGQKTFDIELPNGMRRTVATADVINASRMAKLAVDATKKVNLGSPEVLIFAPEVPEKILQRLAIISTEMAWLALGRYAGARVNLTDKEVTFTIRTDHPVLGGVDGETRIHDQDLILNDGAQVSITALANNLSVLRRTK